MQCLEPCLAVLADLSSCWCLETLKISTRDRLSWDPSESLPDITLHEISSLKSVDIFGWYPEGKLTLPTGCLLHLMMVLERHTQWCLWQRKGSPPSMLHLDCHTLQAWPAGVPDMLDLRYLELHCEKLQDQDLAALQHIPHVCLVFRAFSTLLLSSGSWQTLQIHGILGFSIDFFNVDAFVRGTERFLFKCPSEEAEEMYRDLRAACVRQRLACHECEHTEFLFPDLRVASLSNVKLCRAPQQLDYDHGNHEDFICTDKHGWPSRDAFPELYR